MDVSFEVDYHVYVRWVLRLLRIIRMFRVIRDAWVIRILKVIRLITVVAVLLGCCTSASLYPPPCGSLSKCVLPFAVSYYPPAQLWLFCSLSQGGVGAKENGNEG
jgi:hypothetical protein